MTTSNTKIILLGTGNPNPDPNHNGPSLAIISNGIPYIVDFGPGLIRQAAALTPRYGGDTPALNPKNLSLAFLTHLHSDHTAGFPDLLLTPWVMGRNQPLKVFGPKGTAEMADHILKAYQAEIHYRLTGREPANDQGWRIVVEEFDGGSIYKDQNLSVEAFKVKHGTLPNAFGFRFKTPDKTIVISGDTAPCENIRTFSQGTDILIHEAYFHKAFSEKEKEWQDYHRYHHTSTLQLADLANDTRPGLLIIYHTLFWGASKKEILKEVTDRYGGKVLLGEDLLIIE